MWSSWARGKPLATWNGVTLVECGVRGGQVAVLHNATASIRLGSGSASAVLVFSRDPESWNPDNDPSAYVFPLTAGAFRLKETRSLSPFVFAHGHGEATRTFFVDDDPTRAQAMHTACRSCLGGQMTELQSETRQGPRKDGGSMLVIVVLTLIVTALAHTAGLLPRTL